MYQSQINVRYAKSLFLLAKEKNMLDEIKQDIELILQWYEENEDIKILLEHPVIKTSKKSEILNEIFIDKINAYSLSLLQLIVKNKRENHLKSICKDFVEIYRKHKGIKTAVLTTTFELTRTHQSNIKKSIEKTFNSIIELNTKIDETLIGGMIIQVDDKRLDLSVTGQIQQLRNQFLNIDFNNKNKNKTCLP